jgi:hypothetical protein
MFPPRQGTWQFMAADLMGSSDIPQTFVHDLESFFWVMLWIVKTLVPSSWDPSTRLEIDAIMNPKSCVKKLFLSGHSTLLEGLQIPNNTALRGLLISLKAIVGARHHLPPSDKNPATGLKMTVEEFAQLRSNYDKGMKHTKDHTLMLNRIEEFLGQTWPDDDKAES